MRFSPRPILFFLVPLVLILASCTSAGNSSGESGSCENFLFPVKPGATWTYSSAGGPGGSLTYTDSIAEVRADGFTLASQFGDSVRRQEWFCRSDGLQALQISGGNAAGITMQGITADFTTTDVKGINLPRELSAGAQWQYELKMTGAMAMPGEAQSPSSGTYLATFQETGKQTVTVPAGTFETARLQANSSVRIISNFQGTPLPITYNAVTLLWYAPGVGLVKSVENGDFGGTTFSITTELQSYQIPQ